MADDDLDTLPENVTLQWLGLHAVANRRAYRAIQDDLNVTSAISRKFENSQVADRQEWRALFDLVRAIRTRLDALEPLTGPMRDR
jgi:hypothetical protein